MKLDEKEFCRRGKKYRMAYLNNLYTLFGESNNEPLTKSEKTSLNTGDKILAESKKIKKT